MLALASSVGGPHRVANRLPARFRIFRKAFLKRALDGSRSAQLFRFYLPELNRYLLDYPAAESSNIQSEFYWEKVNFGLKPTLRMVQAIVYRGTSATGPAYAVAVKQLYSNHYFQAALDLTVCARAPDGAGRRGLYMITLKGSKQAGLGRIEGWNCAQGRGRQDAFFSGADARFH